MYGGIGRHFNWYSLGLGQQLKFSLWSDNNCKAIINYFSNVFIEEDGSKVFLVDFQKKAIDNIREEREQQRKEEERLQEEDIISDYDVPSKVEGEEWSVDIGLLKNKIRIITVSIFHLCLYSKVRKNRLYLSL